MRPFGPVVEKIVSENAFLTEEPIDIIQTGRFNHVPLIMGFVSKEGMLFEIIKHLQKKSTKTSLEDEIFYNLNIPQGSEKSKKIAALIKEKYFDNKDPSDSDMDKMFTVLPN